MITDEKLKRLNELKELLDKGILTQDEFEKLKANLIDSMSQKESAIEDVKNEENIYSEQNSGETKTPSALNSTSNDMFEYMPNSEKNGETEKKAKKAKKPFYKRVWFIVLAIIILLLIFTSIFGSEDGSSTDTTTSNEESSVVETEESSVETEEESAPVVTSISAEYSGDTSAGVVLDSDNSDITVTATYDDGTSNDVTGWKIEKAKKLKAGKDTTVKITYEGQICKLTVSCTSMTKAEYKENCEEISYKKIARDPDDYKYRDIKISGKVIQVVEDGDDLTLRVATSDGYDDVFLVSYTYTDKDSRILEDDNITVWGICAGTVTYESTMGGNITIPAMYAKYFKIKE